MLSNPRFLFLLLCSDLVPGSFPGLVDSGSTDCFVDTYFVTIYKLSFQEVNSLSFALIDDIVNQCVSHVIVRVTNSKPELSQLLFISIRQRKLVKSPCCIGLSTYTDSTWSVH